MMSTSQLTRNDLPQVLNNFSLVKILSFVRIELGLLATKEIFSKFNQNTSKEQNDVILIAFCEAFNVSIEISLNFHQNTSYVICEVRRPFNNVYKCNFLDETSKEKLHGEELSEEEFLGEKLFGKELSSGKIALGKKLLLGRIHREELLIYGTKLLY
jgi:hypothetical protein